MSNLLGIFLSFWGVRGKLFALKDLQHEHNFFFCFHHKYYLIHYKKKEPLIIVDNEVFFELVKSNKTPNYQCHWSLLSPFKIK